MNGPSMDDDMLLCGKRLWAEPVDLASWDITQQTVQCSEDVNLRGPKKPHSQLPGKVLWAEGMKQGIHWHDALIGCDHKNKYCP
jgi:hypothetical protein